MNCEDNALTSWSEFWNLNVNQYNTFDYSIVSQIISNILATLFESKLEFIIRTKQYRLWFNTGGTLSFKVRFHQMISSAAGEPATAAEMQGSDDASSSSLCSSPASPAIASSDAHAHPSISSNPTSASAVQSKPSSFCSFSINSILGQEKKSKKSTEEEIKVGGRIAAKEVSPTHGKGQEVMKLQVDKASAMFPWMCYQQTRQPFPFPYSEYTQWNDMFSVVNKQINRLQSELQSPNTDLKYSDIWWTYFWSLC